MRRTQRGPLWFRGRRCLKRSIAISIEFGISCRFPSFGGRLEKERRGRDRKSGSEEEERTKEEKKKKKKRRRRKKGGGGTNEQTNEKN